MARKHGVKCPPCPTVVMPLPCTLHTDLTCSLIDSSVHHYSYHSPQNINMLMVNCFPTRTFYSYHAQLPWQFYKYNLESETVKTIPSMIMFCLQLKKWPKLSHARVHVDVSCKYAHYVYTKVHHW